MRFLLDEHLSPVIADEVRRRGHDVVAAVEVGLGQQPDAALLAHAAAGGRAVVTANYADFRELHGLYLGRGERHWGIAFVPGRFSLARDGFGRLVTALEKLATEHPAEAALENAETWLRD